MDFEPVARFGLLMVRPGMLIVAAPAFGGGFAPAVVKAGLTVLVALMLVPIVSLPDLPSTIGLTAVVAREATVGLALAFGLRVLVAGAEFAGQLTGFQLGFTYASLVDPQTGARNNVLSSLYGTLALVIVFLVNAHHDFLRALWMSYQALPVGLGGVEASLSGLVARGLGFVFLIGAQLAAPVVIVLLIVELALGLLSRAAPTLNIMVQGFPIRIVVGLLAMAATIRVVPIVVHGSVPGVLDLATRLAAVFR